MPRRTKNQNTLSLGDNNVYCDVCGFKFKSCDVRERWDGLIVCQDDYEKRHPMDFFRGFPDDQTAEEPSSDDAGQQADNANTDVEGNTFPDTSDPNSTLTSVPSGTNFGNDDIT